MPLQCAIDMHRCTEEIRCKKMTYEDRVGPLVFVKVTVEDNVNTIGVQHLLHGFAHALSLQVVSGVCNNHVSHESCTTESSDERG